MANMVEIFRGLLIAASLQLRACPSRKFCHATRPCSHSPAAVRANETVAILRCAQRNKNKRDELVRGERRRTAYDEEAVSYIFLKWTLVCASVNENQLNWTQRDRWMGSEHELVAQRPTTRASSIHASVRPRLQCLQPSLLSASRSFRN
ncbi:uncharacterized protein PV07_07046 [Cladophialophora immunda]|uniref:Uncharacterized protein n=1 Tax=Cladophialophora immunda TaxID=569365 RepID=A0A0D2CA37_9EURO|nr:uncharacterized protein PV07_07046 [Cladophialophora immunda]KIW27295.1 hypothetical protein PV07_07046 [Cladophialophora immunda]